MESDNKEEHNPWKVSANLYVSDIFLGCVCVCVEGKGGGVWRAIEVNNKFSTYEKMEASSDHQPSQN